MQETSLLLISKIPNIYLLFFSGVRRYFADESPGEDGEQANRHGNQRGRGRGAGRGRGKHPPGLSGREIGLWYASRGRAKKKEREAREVCLLPVFIQLKSGAI